MELLDGEREYMISKIYIDWVAWIFGRDDFTIDRSIVNIVKIFYLNQTNNQLSEEDFRQE